MPLDLELSGCFMFMYILKSEEIFGGASKHVETMIDLLESTTVVCPER